jgi:hypothetical protein
MYLLTPRIEDYPLDIWVFVVILTKDFFSQDGTSNSESGHVVFPKRENRVPFRHA